jgi:hypothetical protein
MKVTSQNHITLESIVLVVPMDYLHEALGEAFKATFDSCPSHALCGISVGSHVCSSMLEVERLLDRKTGVSEKEQSYDWANQDLREHSLDVVSKKVVMSSS